MRKLVMTTALVVATSAVGFAQKGNVNVNIAIKAANESTPKFDEARAAIKQAISDPGAAADPKTWFVAADIEDKFYTAEEAKLIQLQITSGKQPEITTPMYQAALQNWTYAVVCDSLDRLPDAKNKVKPKYTRKLKPAVTRFRNQFPSAGQIEFAKENYPGAVTYWGTYVDQIDHPLFDDIAAVTKADSIHYLIAFYASYAASKMGDHQKSLHYLNISKQHPTQALASYQQMVYEYEQLKDTVGQIETLKAGMEVFPKESYFLLALANIYITTNNIEKAVSLLDVAIERDPTQAQLYDVKGSLLERLERVEEAIIWFKKSIEIDPNYAEGVRNVGRYYYNKALVAVNEANLITDNKKYQEEIKKANDIYREALPYFEKVQQLLPDDRACKVALMQIYYNLNMTSEYKVICKDLDMPDC